jgi:hypothetical protein
MTIGQYPGSVPVTVGHDWGLLPVMAALLFLFGFGYDRLVGWMERNGYDEGYTAILVVVGTLVTLGGVALVDWQAAVLALGAFAFSGFWMCVGSWWRHVQKRKHGQKRIRKGEL